MGAGLMGGTTRAVGCAMCIVACSVAGRALVAADSEQQEQLQSILDRIHNHASGDAWRQTGWKDESIEGWLDGVTTSIGKARTTDSTLPVKIADVTAGDSQPDRTADKTLIVGKNISLGKVRLRNCILLADGNIEVDSLDGCVAVGGVVTAKQSLSSVIVAGTYINIGTDGERTRLDKTEKRSLILTRGWANVVNVSGSIIGASEGVSVGRSVNGGIFINAILVTGQSFSIGRKPRSIKVRDLPLEDLPAIR